MKNSTIFLMLASASSFSWSEISSLTSEELTDTYIKDTTVIVRQPKQEEPKTQIPVKLKVTPLEEAAQVLPDDPNNQMASISSELSSYDDLNNFRALDNDLQIDLPPASTQFLRAPASAEAINQIRTLYKIPDNIDLTTLNFKEGFADNLLKQNPNDENRPLIANGDSLTINISNDGNFNTQQIQTPNGEISVNVTPEFINYTINLPK